MPATRLWRTQIVNRVSTIERELDVMFASVLTYSIADRTMMVSSPADHYWTGGAHIITIDLNTAIDIEAVTDWLYNAYQLCDDDNGCDYCGRFPSHDDEQAGGGERLTRDDTKLPRYITYWE
jgi:hypothetical protein